MDHQHMGARAFLNVRQIRNELAHVTRRIFIATGQDPRHGVNDDEARIMPEPLLELLATVDHGVGVSPTAAQID
jgi:hypothetical protein